MGLHEIYNICVDQYVKRRPPKSAAGVRAPIAPPSLGYWPEAHRCFEQQLYLLTLVAFNIYPYYGVQHMQQ